MLAERYELAMALACVGGILQGRGVYPRRTFVMSGKQKTYRFKSGKERERVKRPDIGPIRPYVHVSERGEFMTEAQEKQALYPWPERRGFTAQIGKFSMSGSEEYKREWVFLDQGWPPV